MEKLSIIIPAFNESERLPETLALVRDWVECQDFKTQVLVVDDGSTDDTAELVRLYAKRFPNLELLSLEQNLGKGGAVKAGMLAARGSWRLIADADNSTPIDQAEKLLEHIDSHEVVIGSRYLRPDSIKVRQPWKRRVLSRLGNILIQSMVLPGIKDTQCGFKLFSAKAAQDIFSQLQTNGWLFDVEVLAIANQRGYGIKEVPVDWYDAKQSKLRAVRTGWKTFRELQSIRRRTRATAAQPQEGTL